MLLLDLWLASGIQIPMQDAPNIQCLHMVQVAQIIQPNLTYHQTNLYAVIYRLSSCGLGSMFSYSYIYALGFGNHLQKPE